LRDHQSEITAAGANLAAIGLGGMDSARHFHDEFKVTFPLLVDEDSAVHRAADLRKANVFHLLRSDNAAARKRAKAAGFHQTGVGKDPFQLGGSFVFGPGDDDIYLSISKTFGDNTPIPDLIAMLPEK
jgi:hypothetical protein